MNKGKRITLIVLLLLVMVGAVLLYLRQAETMLPEHDTQRERTEETEQMKSQVPDFTALDEAGNEVHLSDYFGKPVVLNFWASWCGPCRMEMPDFDVAYMNYGDEINFLMVNLTDGKTETIETASEFISGEGYSFPLLFDTAQEAAYAYGVYSIPVTYFIDAEGNLVAQAKGAIDAETLQTGLDMLLE